MKTYIKIGTDKEALTILKVEDNDPNEYLILQKAVDGPIEMVATVWDDHFLYVNEEGKLRDLKIVNMLASKIAKVDVFDFIVGDAVLVGPLDEEGNHESVAADMEARLVEVVTSSLKIMWD